MKDSDNFYCNQKFTWLSIDLEKKLTYSCCSASPAKIDLKWLKNNPGHIFNTPLIQQERKDMLANQPVKSCEISCWKPEQQNKTSRRLLMHGYDRTHTDVTALPKTLNIILGSDCNLTCVYCCKQYSSSWLRDVKSNGPYLEQEQFKFTKLDQVLEKLSQKDHLNANSTKILHKEISALSSVNEIIITGGEPFLYNNLSHLINSIDTTAKIRLYSGLGVNTARLSAQLDKIKNPSNIIFNISAENLGKFYEFNRFGNSYKNFLDNLQLLENNQWTIEFMATVSNLTLHGLCDFAEKFCNKKINYGMCASPDFLSVNVLDQDSKDTLAKQLVNSSISIKDQIIQTLMIHCTNEQKTDFSIYVKEFARRRNLSLDIYPASLLNWINNVV
jgi:wyosine [tRNA(Phe)-imidazoG37] synthetase (radical SAM superfamily)